MSLGSSSEQYDSRQRFDSSQDRCSLAAPTAPVNLEPIEDQLAKNRLPATPRTSSLIYFVDRAVPNTDSGPIGSDSHKIVEGRLENPTELLSDLIARYGSTAVDLTILLHKPSLVSPILRLMSELEAYPDLFSRSQITIIPHIFRDKKIFEWVAEKPFKRLPRIKIAGD